MSTLKQLVDAQQHLADSVLSQNAAVVRLTDTIERLILPFEHLRRDVHDLKNDHETAKHRLDYVLNKLDKDLAVLVDNVKDAQGDVRQLSKEVTGAHRLPLAEIEPKKPTVVAIIEAFEKLPATTKLLIFILALMTSLSGWLVKVLTH